LKIVGHAEPIEAQSKSAGFLVNITPNFHGRMERWW